jgi:hypothetical protein
VPLGGFVDGWGMLRFAWVDLVDVLNWWEIENIVGASPDRMLIGR